MNPGTPQADYILGSNAARLDSQPRMFKKHKVLPHPRKEKSQSAAMQALQRSIPRKYDLEIDARLLQSARPQPPSPPRRQRPRRQSAAVAAAGPDLPPTPPAHSRTSSSSKSGKNASPTYPGSPLQSIESIQESPPPTTPANDQTPPTPNLTPDRTPPGPAGRYARPRPLISDRIPSKVTVDSRADSYITAPETQNASDDEDDGRSTLRPALPSAKTSQSTVRQLNGEARLKPKTVGLGLSLESSPQEDLTPKADQEFNVFDGEWGPRRGGEASDNERRPKKAQANGYKGDEVVEDMTITPTKATQALRSMSLQESPIVYPSRRVPLDKVQQVQKAQPTQPAQPPQPPQPPQPTPSNSESTISTDYRRSSILSTKSTASTVVEAILVETLPERRKTLRHVRKQTTLRDSSSDLSPSSSAITASSVAADDTRRRRYPNLGDVPRDSYASTSTTNSISSRKARRDVWKNGGIPVVVVPGRRSSTKATNKEPSLRSTSSRRSQQSQDLDSTRQRVTSNIKEYVPVFDRPRRGRALSEPDGSRPGDQRTIDFAPRIPTRSSSLSAPTSRDASRTGSLTAESLKAHTDMHAIQARQVDRELEKLNVRKQRSVDKSGVAQPTSAVGQKSYEAPSGTGVSHRQGLVSTERPSANESPYHPEVHGFQESHDSPDDNVHRIIVDRYGDPFFGKRLSVQNTPFSQASVETTGTSHAEVSEAMAVNIYPHQNKSVMIVDHSTKPSESSSLEQYKTSELQTPTIRTVDADGGIPATPPQTFAMDDVDSPLRNPRAPPEPPFNPPAINFIPATPSGLTPAAELNKQLGIYYEVTEEKPPKREVSLLRRALTLHRNSAYYGPSASRGPSLLTRTLSLTRGNRKRGEDQPHGSDGKRPVLRRRATSDDAPRDATRLHPFWRPTYYDDRDSDSSEDWDGEEADDRTYKYPPVDNRPQLPRRSLSARMKRTFAILPIQDDKDDFYPASGSEEVDRRTIRRTPSGNLRVMKFRGSMESLPRIEPNDGRPYTAPDQSTHGRHRWFWQSSPKASADSFRRNSFLLGFGSKINITRRVSERRREKRSQELRRIISGPREVRDGVGDVIRRNSYRETFTQQRRD
ncbi:hypothetical protein B0T17DRAFT_587060 [Bombardia bombarda]|uniref:Uncharacterized protein n=1 Tax=Bombardia bombarda TaxID=252184 RepID=A0AA39XL18_9PEZI|nr:hypothetical protein B0T17DRAFT_587060 [Bombardia bombarda]